MSLIRILFILYFFSVKVNASLIPVTPFDFGLASALSGIERYWALYMAHEESIKRHTYVDYSGIEELHIEIPADAKPINLGGSTDFKGLKLYVTNRSKQITLFTLIQDLKPISISKQDLNQYNFSSYHELADGLRLLVIHDQTPWIDKRLGFDYPHFRKDVLLLENADAKNSVIFPYTSELSQPLIYYASVSSKEKVIKNLNFIRTDDCTYKTFCLSISNHNNVRISHVNIVTPDNKMSSDAAISIQNCTRTKFDHITINGTYSQIDQYGYGVMLNNVWDTSVSHMFARGNWGVFGNNNVNNVSLDNCDINRFDIHCYGRDIHFHNCKIIGLYNQYSSVFGKITHSNCIFDNSYPYMNGGSYNAFTFCELYFKKCTFIMNKRKNGIVFLYGLSSGLNTRPELQTKYLPNIHIKNCKFEFIEPMNKWYVFCGPHNTSFSDVIDGHTVVILEKLQLPTTNTLFDLFNIKFNIKHPVRLICNY